VAYSIQQQMMTLAALAYTGSVQRPSGETLVQQASRIADGITAQLAMPSLATAGRWKLGWLGLTADRANLAFLAKGPIGVALVVRGTVESSTIDLLEDLDVGTLVAFPESAPFATSRISLGAYNGLTEVMTMTDPRTNVSLETALGQPSANTLYVTGHSLGGALTTVLAVRLQMQGWPIEAHTFAAPTAGDQGFADWYDGRSITSYRTYGAYDMIPYAWADLIEAGSWYPSPGPYADDSVRDVIRILDDLRGTNVYAQPSDNVQVVNQDYALRCTSMSTDPFLAFLEEMAFQHGHNTYLTLLGAPTVPDGPAVSGLSAHAGWRSGGMVMSVYGSGFTPDCAVDFGSTPAGQTRYVSTTELTTTTPPMSLGPHVVRVSNDIGMSSDLDPSALFLAY
jgi:hypothetical protein